MRKILFALLVLVYIPACSSAEYQEGRHYQILPFGESPGGDAVEVREFFWYGCPHCYHLEPELDNWLKKKPKNAKFVRTPALLPRELVHAKTYYALESLGKVDAVHKPIFEAIHLQEQHMHSPEAMATFVAKYGVDKAAFLKAYASFGVDSQTREAVLLASKYQIRSVPTVVVDGRYQTSASHAGGNAELIKVIDYLVAKASKERKAKR